MLEQEINESEKSTEYESGHKKLTCQNAMHPSTVESVNRWLQIIANGIQYSRKVN